MTKVKYPEIEVQLSGNDGNAFAILSTVCSELKANGVSKAEIKEFTDEATSGDYGELLQTCARWVNVI